MIRLNDAVMYKSGNDWVRARVEMLTEMGFPIVTDCFGNYIVLDNPNSWHKVGKFVPCNGWFSQWQFEPLHEFQTEDKGN